MGCLSRVVRSMRIEERGKEDRGKMGSVCVWGFDCAGQICVYIPGGCRSGKKEWTLHKESGPD